MPSALIERDSSIVAPDGIRLSLSSFGEQEAPGVLLLHGFGQSRGAWQGTARRLAAAGWHVLTLDARGHGDSDWAPSYSFAMFEQDVRQAVGLFPRPPALIGASMGGILALLSQEHADSPAAALALVDVVPHFDLDSGQRVQGFMSAHRDGFATLEAASDAVAGFLVNRPRPADPRGLLRNLRRGDDDRYRWKWDPAFADGINWMSDQSGPVEVIAAAMTERMNAAADRLQIPTLLIRGKLSKFVPDEAVTAFVARVPQAEFVDVTGAGHMVAGDRNDVFTDAVLDFLARHHPSQP